MIVIAVDEGENHITACIYKLYFRNNLLINNNMSMIGLLVVYGVYFLVSFHVIFFMHILEIIVIMKRWSLRI